MHSIAQRVIPAPPSAEHALLLLDSPSCPVEAVGLDIKHAVEARAVVLPGTDRCQLDDLRFREVMPQSTEQLIIHRSRRVCDALRQL